MSHSGSSTSISDNTTPSSGQGGYTPIVTPQMLQEVRLAIDCYSHLKFSIFIKKLTAMCLHDSLIKI